MNKLEELKIKLLTLQIKKEYSEMQILEKNTIQKSAIKIALEQVFTDLTIIKSYNKKSYEEICNILDKHFCNLL